MKKLSKKEKAIYDQFSKYGANAKEWMLKCVLMLPEIEVNRIWEKKGFGSIYECAAKIAGMSRHKVDDSLRILRKIADKPALMEVVKVKGLNAVRPAATIVTKENDKFLAGKASEMSKNTFATFIKDFKNEAEFRPGTGSPTNNGSNKVKSFQKNDIQKNGVLKNEILSVDEKVQLSMKVDPEVVEALKKIKGAGDWNEAMKKLLKLSRGELEAVEKKQQEKERRFRAELEAEKPEPFRSNSHKAPVVIEKFIKKRSGGKCEHPNCEKAGENIHHIEPFALTRMHDPDKMLHVCKAHHQLIHKGNIDDGEIRVGFEAQYEQWRQVEELPSYDIKNLINARVAEFQW